MQDSDKKIEKAELPKAVQFVMEKKKTFKTWKYRVMFDSLLNNARANLLNTDIRYSAVQPSDRSFVQLVIPRQDGTNDVQNLAQVKSTSGDIDRGDIPRSKSSLAFSKILTATAAIASNLPDGVVQTVSKVKSRILYAMWKKTWNQPESNGHVTLSYTAQNLLTLGWGAWRVFPKNETAPVTKTLGNGKKVKTHKVIYDGIYREPLDPARTWIGTSYRPSSDDNRAEVLYEIDVTIEEYRKLVKSFGKRVKKSTPGTTEESPLKTEEQDYVTLMFYENPKENKFIICTQASVLFEGELPNEDVYGGVVISQCWNNDVNNPYGVGLWEIMRGDMATLDYIQSLTVEELEAEVRPIILGIGGTDAVPAPLEIKRGANVINRVPAGLTIEKMSNNGNVTLGMNAVQTMKTQIEENTGINDSLSGANTQGGLGETVLQKEAALNRLITPRNSLKRALEFDACVVFSWFEQLYLHGREYELGTSEEIEAFVNANRHMDIQGDDEEMESPESEEGEDGLSSGIAAPKKIVVSPYIDLDFDVKDSEEGGKDVMEYGIPKNSYPMNDALKVAMESEEETGYSHPYLIIDPNSMMTPSTEIQKQTSLSLLQPIQNTIQLIYSLARQDPDQSVAQLKTFSTFCEQQKLNIFDYIPKDKYDQLMSGAVPVDMQTQMAMQNHQMAMQTGQESGEGLPVQSDGTQFTAPQNPMEMRNNQTDMQSSFQGSMEKMDETL